MKNIFWSIFGQIFPALYAYKANKRLQKKVDSEDSLSSISNMDNVNDISMDDFRQRYRETFEVKNKFEDKAKTNVIGITIAITVIMGASGLISSLVNKYSNPIIHWLSFFVLLITISYLLVSGIAAISVLHNKNTMSIIELSDMSADSLAAKERYDDCTVRNIKRNTIRNNIVNASYIGIRNALICMIILFVLIAIPISGVNSQADNSTIIQSYSNISYRSTITIPENISIEEINSAIIEDKTSREVIEEGVVYNFIDVINKYCVRYKCLGSEIIVEELFLFDNVLNES